MKEVTDSSLTTKLQGATYSLFSVDENILECGTATNKENLIREEPKKHRLAVRLSSMIVNQGPKNSPCDSSDSSLCGFEDDPYGLFENRNSRCESRAAANNTS